MKKIFKTIMRRVAFAFLSLFVVLMMCAMVVSLLEASKP